MPFPCVFRHRYAGPSASVALCILFLAVSSSSGQFHATPLCDMAPTARYLDQYQGGLYLDGLNTMPADHAAAGMQRRALIQPLNTNGQPDANGRYIMLSVGMSNTRIEFAPFQELVVPGWVQLNNNHSCAVRGTLVTYNGARAGQTSEYWVDTIVPANPVSFTTNNWVRLRDELTNPSRTEGLSLSKWQVQAGWIKLTNIDPVNSLSSGAPRLQKNAFVTMSEIASALRTFKSEYPNIQMVFLTSRVYSYATSTSPEPFAYEDGFVVKWLIEAQIRQMRGETSEWDDVVGDLRYSVNGQDGVVPWIAWGPYLWADGLNPRSDGLTWAADEYYDTLHPDDEACDKIAGLMLNYFNSSPFAAGWLGPALATVVGKHVFYNHCSLDGDNSGANANDDAAIDAAKSALLPGQVAGSGNITAYAKGLNGVMVDIAGAPNIAAVTAGDFLFQVSTNGTSWTTAPTPAVSVRTDGGTGGSDRVTLIWSDNIVQDCWLRVEVKAGRASTGLSAADVFYFGNLRGDIDGDRAVNAADLAALRQNFLRLPGDPSRNDSADLDKDGNINTVDLARLRQNYLGTLVALTAP